jgi:ABC-type transport system involved in multi-copper enzyme maturation permease subunit
VPIREGGYYNWEGTLLNSKVKWFPIFTNGIRSVYKKRFSKLLFATASSLFFIFLIALYVSSKPELKMMTRLVNMISTDAMLFRTYYTNGFLIFMCAMLSVFSGAELISNDLKHKSIALYLARPLSKLDYITGKFSITLFYQLLFTLVPGILLVIFKVIFTGDYSAGITLLVKSIAFPLVISLFWSSLILMLSSISENSRFVNIIFFVVFFLTQMLAGMFWGIFRNSNFLYISIEKNIQQFGSFVFGTRLEFDSPGWISGAILLGMTALFLLILSYRLRKVEV